MNKPIIQVLKESYEGWSLSLKLRTTIHEELKTLVKQKELELKNAKQALYQAYKQKRDAQSNVKSTGAKYKSFISKRRSWAKKNYGKVLDILEKNK